MKVDERIALGGQGPLAGLGVGAFREPVGPGRGLYSGRRKLSAAFRFDPGDRGLDDLSIPVGGVGLRVTIRLVDGRLVDKIQGGDTGKKCGGCQR